MDSGLRVGAGTIRHHQALDGRNGKLRKGFPVEMGSIQAGVACGDVDGDGQLDLVACDTLGNIAAFRADGTEIWDRVLSGSVRPGRAAARPQVEPFVD